MHWPKGFFTANRKPCKECLIKPYLKEMSTEVDRAAGICAAKRCADWITFCHPIPLDWLEVKLEPKKNTIKVSAEVRSVWKTGVQMEAITVVSAALLNAYDMPKPLDDSLSFGDIRVVMKKGGKSDFSDSSIKEIETAGLVISDSTHAGTRKDKSGKVIQEFLADKPVLVDFYEVFPGDGEVITERLRQLADEEKVKLISPQAAQASGPGMLHRKQPWQ